jgi:hypothetical protein
MSQEFTLSSLIVPSKEVQIDYPGYDGFKVTINFLSRDELIKLRKKSTKTVWKQRQQSEEFNEELFLKLYTESVVKGWTGLKLKYLKDLILIDVGTKDLETQLEFSVDNAVALMKGSTEFDTFITENMSDLSVFSKAS